MTKLMVNIDSLPTQEPSTIVAGLGALTALSSLAINNLREDRAPYIHPGDFSPLVIDRVTAPHLTSLRTDWAFTPLNLAAFLNLVEVDVWPCAPRQAPIILRSLVAPSRLRTLVLGNSAILPPFGNLAELFVDGGGLPTLRDLQLTCMVLEWDATGLAGMPTATEFVFNLIVSVFATQKTTTLPLHHTTPTPPPLLPAISALALRYRTNARHTWATR